MFNAKLRESLQSQTEKAILVALDKIPHILTEECDRAAKFGRFQTTISINDLRSGTDVSNDLIKAEIFKFCKEHNLRFNDKKTGLYPGINISWA